MSQSVVEAIKSDLEARGVNLQGPDGAFQITSRVGWALRREGWGYIRKRPEQNGAFLNGEKFGVDVLLKKDGTWVDMLINAENVNQPAWQVHVGTETAGDTWAPPVDRDAGGVEGGGEGGSFPDDEEEDENVFAEILEGLTALRAEVKAIREAAGGKVEFPTYEGSNRFVGKFTLTPKV